MAVKVAEKVRQRAGTYKSQLWFDETTCLLLKIKNFSSQFCKNSTDSA